MAKKRAMTRRELLDKRRFWMQLMILDAVVLLAAAPIASCIRWVLGLMGPYPSPWLTTYAVQFFTVVMAVVIGFFYVRAARRLGHFLMSDFGPECFNCGYELSAIPTIVARIVKCPECGDLSSLAEWHIPDALQYKSRQRQLELINVMRRLDRAFAAMRLFSKGLSVLFVLVVVVAVIYTICVVLMLTGTVGRWLPPVTFVGLVKLATGLVIFLTLVPWLIANWISGLVRKLRQIQLEELVGEEAFDSEPPVSAGDITTNGA